jgi:hypothetical protein
MTVAILNVLSCGCLKDGRGLVAILGLGEAGPEMATAAIAEPRTAWPRRQEGKAQNARIQLPMPWASGLKQATVEGEWFDGKQF